MMSQAYSPRPFPSLWKTFKRIINGKVRKFWVQDLPEDQMNLALDYLCEYFAKDEPMCQAMKVIEDEESMKYMRECWDNFLKTKCSLACFTKLENGENKMVAVNCCMKKSVNEKIDVKEYEIGKINQVIFGNLDYVANKKSPFKELCINEYLNAMGLVTIPEYRGYNIGLELLHSRRSLCRAMGLRATVTLFTSPASQRLAEKAGFEDLVSVTFEEIEQAEPRLKIPNITEYSKRIRNMYILYD